MAVLGSRVEAALSSSKVTLFGGKGLSFGVESAAKIITHADPLELQVTHEMTMGKNAYRRLVSDIKQNGIQEPIKYVEHAGKLYVVDGHHRLAAAR